MPRAIVYTDQSVQRQYLPLHREATQGGQGPSHRPGDPKAKALRIQAIAAAEQPPAAEEAPAGAPPPDVPDRDDLLARIAKYVPAEMITLTTLGFAAFPPGSGKWTVWIYVAIGAALNAIYLFGTSLAAEDKTPRPPWYFYVLSALAFVGWSFATLDAVQAKAHLTGDNATTQQGFILLATAIFIPLVDLFLSSIFFKKSGT